MKKQLKDSERGFTVVEVLIVLAVGLLIVMNSGKLSDWLFGTAKLGSTEQSISAFRINIQHAYTDVRSYASISNEELISAMAVPPPLLNGDGTAIVDAWNGDVTVASADDGRSFTIELTQVPQSECIKLGSFQLDTWEQVTVNGTEIERGSIVTTDQCTSETENTIVYKSH